MEASGLGPWLRGLRFWEGSHRIPLEREKKQPAAALLAGEEGPGRAAAAAVCISAAPNTSWKGRQWPRSPAGTAAMALTRAQDETHGTGSIWHSSVPPSLQRACRTAGTDSPGGSRTQGGHPRAGRNTQQSGSRGAGRQLGCTLHSEPAQPRSTALPRGEPLHAHSTAIGSTSWSGWSWHTPGPANHLLPRGA